VSKWRDRDEFKARVLEWTAKLDVKASAIYVRPMRRKWASCSTAGTLSFNNELLNLNRELGDYVIVHELLHFSVPNHGRLWKSLMRAHLGDYERLDERLRRFNKLGDTRNEQRNGVRHLEEGCLTPASPLRPGLKQKTGWAPAP
jgi:predicted metal-dependent hydrolase